MKKRLNYRELIKSWMQMYGPTVELSSNLFSSIWMRMQSAKTEVSEDRSEKNGISRPRLLRTKSSNMLIAICPRQ